MKRKMALKLSIVASLALAFGSLLISSSARAEGCSKSTLLGDYGYVAEGELLPAPGVSLSFRSVGMAHFDGNGNLTWLEHTVVGGTPVAPHWQAASGTYLVHSNCTGVAVVNTPNSPVPLHLTLVILKEGREFHSILDASSVGTVFTRLE
jgi:hypothetical protein